MSDEIPPWLAERDAKSGKTRKSRRLPEGCGCCIWLFAGACVWGLVSLYGVNAHVDELRQNESRNMSRKISNAVEQFYADYSRLPLPSGPPPQGGDRDTDTSTTHGFAAILLAKEAESGERQNTHRTNYLEGIWPARGKTTDESPWRNGAINDPLTGACGIVDSYGKPFRIRLDTNGDQQVANPDPDQAAEGRLMLPKRVIVWGAGKDGKWETWDDNPKSWE